MRIYSLALTALLLSGLAAVAAAQAKAPALGHLTCTYASGTIAADVYGYALDMQPSSTTGSESSGAGAGKVTYSETEMDLPQSAFIPLARDANAGTVFSECQLTGLAGGLTADFREVILDDVKLAGGTARSTQEVADNRGAMVQLSFSYASVALSSPGQGTSTPITTQGGWNRVTNTGGTGVGPASL